MTTGNIQIIHAQQTFQILKEEDMKKPSEKRMKTIGTALLFILMCAPVTARAATDRLTVEDPATGTVKFKVDSDGNVAGGAVNASAVVFPYGSGTGRDGRITNAALVDNIASVAFSPDNGTNAGTALQIIPRGTGFSPNLKSQLSVYNSDYIADSTNYDVMVLRAAGTAFTFNSLAFGTGALLPIKFQINNATDMTIDTSHNIGIGTTAPTQKLEVNGGVRLNTASAKPACDSTTRGTLWVTQGSTDDQVEVCVMVSGALTWKSVW